MGWKAVKEHYRIGHNVSVVDGQVTIGSPYIPNLITVAADGSIANRYERSGNDDLQRYQQEMEADPAKLRELLGTADRFERSVPVYTYSKGAVVEKFCEALGWPNVTHDGEMMYDNTFFGTREDAIRSAITDSEISIKWRRTSIENAARELANQRDELATADRELAQYRVLLGRAAEIAGVSEPK